MRKALDISETYVRTGLMFVIAISCAKAAFDAGKIKKTVENLQEMVQQGRTDLKTTITSVEVLGLRVGRLEWELEAINKRVK